MKAILKLYSKIFLGVGILLFGSFCAFELFIQNDISCSTQLIIALANTIFFSLVIILWHIYNLKSLGVDEFTDDSLSVRHTFYKETEMTQEEFLQILQTEDYKIKSMENEVQLKTKVNWYSFGEKISILFGAPHNGIRKVKITSKPVLPFAVIDNGQNRVNIDDIACLL